MSLPWHGWPRCYTGVGSRETPSEVIAEMVAIARALAGLGWTCRTGGAEGADHAFMRGVADFPGSSKLAVYLPWESYERANIPRCAQTFCPPTAMALFIAGQHHPAWRALRQSVRLLHARNVHAVLGPQCNVASSFLVCWTPDGAVDKTGPRTGGTGQAIRIAAAHDVPRYNLRRDDHRVFFRSLVELGSPSDARSPAP